MSFIEAAHNIVLTHFMRSLKEVMEQTICHYLDSFYANPSFVDEVTRQHRNVVDAVIQGDAEAARQAAVFHLDFSYQYFQDYRIKHRFSESARLYQTMYDKNQDQLKI